jgi:hypothetical protein
MTGILKTLYALSIFIVFSIFTLVANGIGGWIVIFNRENFLRDRNRTAVFLLAIVILMIYGLIKYDSHDKILVDKFGAYRSRKMRFEQIIMILVICSFLLLTS